MNVLIYGDASALAARKRAVEGTLGQQGTGSQLNLTNPLDPKDLLALYNATHMNSHNRCGNYARHRPA